MVVGATVLGSNYRCRQVGFITANYHNVGTPFGPYGIDMHGIRQSPSLYGGSIRFTIRRPFDTGDTVHDFLIPTDTDFELGWAVNEDSSDILSKHTQAGGVRMQFMQDGSNSFSESY